MISWWREREMRRFSVVICYAMVFDVTDCAEGFCVFVTRRWIG